MDNVVVNISTIKEQIAEILGCIFRKSSVYSVTFLSYPAKLQLTMSPENGKRTKRNAKGTSSISELQLIYKCISNVGLH